MLSSKVIEKRNNTQIYYTCWMTRKTIGDLRMYQRTHIERSFVSKFVFVVRIKIYSYWCNKCHCVNVILMRAYARRNPYMHVCINKFLTIHGEWSNARKVVCCIVLLVISCCHITKYTYITLKTCQWIWSEIEKK